MNQSFEQAASILVERRINGIKGDRLPESMRPKNLDDALIIQNAATKLWCEKTGDSICGWKTMQPPPDFISVAPIFSSTVHSSLPVTLRPKGDVAAIEPEIAFVFGGDLPPRAKPYSPEEVDAAIIRTHMALELIDCRYDDASICEIPELLADNMLNQGLYVGPQIDSDLAKNKGEMRIKVSASNQATEYQGKHPNLAPRAGLYWLAEFLRKQGKGIVAGQTIITGSFAGVLEVPLNQNINIAYEDLGEMTVTFLQKK